MALLLAGVALLPRAVAVGPFITSDEEKWVARSHAFLHAIEQGDYAATNQTGHPGVTTMWAGSLGILLSRVLVDQGIIAPYTPQSDLHMLLLLRLPVAFITSLCVALVYLLLRVLLNKYLALIAALLIATNPFLVGHSQLLHVDALLTAFMTVALLAAMVAFRLDVSPAPSDGDGGEGAAPPLRWWALVLAGVASGLAFLTKSPSALLIPMMGVIVLAGYHRSPTHAARLLSALAVWGAVALGTWVALWPAAWDNLPAAVMAIINEVARNGAIPHNNGNFFLGQPVADPGPRFYPLALVLRLTPWALVGIVTLALRIIDRPTRAVGPGGGWLWVVLLFVLLFLLPMSVLSKKFDRYALPIFPMLDIVAVIGLAGLWHAVHSRLGGALTTLPHRLQSALPATLATTLCAASTGYVLWYHPYELAFYNPLLGGAESAVRTLLVGRGEGLDQVAAYLNANCRDHNQPVFALNASGLLEDLIPNRVENELYASAYPPRLSYAVLYINQRQRNPQIYQTMRQMWCEQQPVHTVRIHGIPYATIYEMPHANFDGALLLDTYTQYDANVRESGRLPLTLYWKAVQPEAYATRLHLRLLNPEGVPIHEVDAPLDQLATAHDGASLMTRLSLPLPLDSPPGRYQVAVSLYAPGESSPLPLQCAGRRADIVDNGTTLLLEPMSVALEPYFGPSIHLHGHAINRTEEQGQPLLHIHTRWKTRSPLATDYILMAQAFDCHRQRVAQMDVPPAGPAAPTSTWTAGTEQVYTHTLPLPDNQEVCWLALALYAPDDMTRLPVRGIPPTPSAAPDAGAHVLLLPISD